MSKNIISIHDPKLKLDVLSSEEIQDIHSASLWIIENVGIRFPSSKPDTVSQGHLLILKKIVRARPELIEKALTTCPPKFDLAARIETDLPLDQSSAWDRWLLG
jgi:trimethylamine:corrinoid methyltransferase-like protein